MAPNNLAVDAVVTMAAGPATTTACRVLTLLIDNYDSYTYNIYQMLAEINGLPPIVIPNDAFGGSWSAAWAEFERQGRMLSKDLELNDPPSEFRRDRHHDEEITTGLSCNVVLSPGPGHPAVAGDFGMCAEAIRSSRVPLFGVCLGHQGLAQVLGGDVVGAPEIMHGRSSRVFLDPSEAEHPASSLFAYIPDGFEVVRYHSLVVSPKTLPRELRVTARTEDGVIMALQHRTRPAYGVQFHPEAVCSEYGYHIFQNFRDITLQRPFSKCPLRHDDHATSVGNGDLAKALVHLPAPVPPTATPQFKVLIDRVVTGLASLDFAQFVFDELFRASTRSFWLDSSNFIDPADQSHAATPVSAQEARQSSRFSYMGDNAGPLSYCMEYSVLQRELRVHGRDGSVEITHGHDALDHLRACLAKFQAHEVVDVQERPLRGSPLPFAFRGGFVGYLGYEMLENGLSPHSTTSGGATGGRSGDVLREMLEHKLRAGAYVPDASFLFADRVLVFDHLAREIYALSIAPTEPSDLEGSRQWHHAILVQLRVLVERFSSTSDLKATASNAASSGRNHTPIESSTAAVVFHPSRSREQYLEDIAEVQRLIQEGETYEVCLTNQLQARVRLGDPLGFYELLRRRNPAPYAGFYLSNPRGAFAVAAAEEEEEDAPVTATMLESYAICCSSPERFLRVGADGWMESKPIKGTRRRGRTPAEDTAIAEELGTCPKDRAENMMIADLVRNDFGRVAAVGSVHVPRLMQVETYATVHQLVTTVRAQRRPTADLIDVLRATFPGGSMTGAPKKRTMQIIRERERHPRGVYSGALGFFSIDGSCDLNIIIRTAVVTPTTVTLGSGGAIIALSDCDDEYDEMLLKTRALVQAIGGFVTGDEVRGARVEATTDKNAQK